MKTLELRDIGWSALPPPTLIAAEQIFTPIPKLSVHLRFCCWGIPIWDAVVGNLQGFVGLLWAAICQVTEDRNPASFISVPNTELRPAQKQLPGENLTIGPRPRPKQDRGCWTTWFDVLSSPVRLSKSMCRFLVLVRIPGGRPREGLAAAGESQRQWA